MRGDFRWSLVFSGEHFSEGHGSSFTRVFMGISHHFSSWVLSYYLIQFSFPLCFESRWFRFTKVVRFKVLYPFISISIPFSFDSRWVSLSEVVRLRDLGFYQTGFSSIFSSWWFLLSDSYFGFHFAGAVAISCGVWFCSGLDSILGLSSFRHQHWSPVTLVFSTLCSLSLFDGVVVDFRCGGCAVLFSVWRLVRLWVPFHTNSPLWSDLFLLLWN